ncbi:MerR family transcriptional regulator [Defluviitalea phaphyphila]|uniref:MerR family transcriptional regulator n=1 Tax=Defluviitalea phaphyphila TaxID=1473580 RepID=UPI00073103DC|nr:MerR family transcriptional regulator [Defluviitalea phaphyphila]
MEEKRYTISEASEILGLEAHVLRYWEEELNLNVLRNEMGHRYYTDKDINVFKNIKNLKEKGLQLRAIKMEIANMKDGTSNLFKDHEINISDSSNKKVKQFQIMMKELFKEALMEYNDLLKEELKNELKHEISVHIKSLEEDYKEKEKMRYRKLDEAIREVQNMRKETATSVAIKVKKPWYKQIIGK